MGFLNCTIGSGGSFRTVMDESTSNMDLYAPVGWNIPGFIRQAPQGLSRDGKIEIKPGPLLIRDNTVDVGDSSKKKR